MERSHFSNMLDEIELYEQSNTAESLSCTTSMSGESKMKMKKRKEMKNTRRFSDEQIRSLELIFKSESKLEAAKKIEVAEELGLHPRQVAIWFQNRRARWKSKELQREYSILHKNYASLSSRFDLLKKENETLLFQIQKLNDRLQRSEPDGIVKEERTDFSFICNDDLNLKEDYYGMQKEEQELSTTMADNSMASSWESLELEDNHQWWDVWS